LPRLDGRTPNKYLDAVLAYLTRATDAENVQDDNFFAAAIILRFAEEFRDYDANDDHAIPSTTPTLRGFIRARANITGNHLYRTWGPLLHPNGTENPTPLTKYEHERQQKARTQLNSLEHACYRVALRQDICAFLLSQTSVQADCDSEIELPATWSALDAFAGKKDDFMWTDRHLRHLANVIQFSFQRDQSTRPEIYHELKQYEKHWEENKPLEFSPFHDPEELHIGSEARREAGQTGFTLPQCWFIGETNVIGMQYYELSRILMAESNPSPPRLGRARHDVETVVKRSVARICGMAMNHASSVFARELAFVAIALTTAYFKDKDEHTELLKVLDSLEDKFGWPIEGKRREILQVWGIGD
jgi:hypothetical protein